MRGDRDDRPAGGFCVWLTGLSGAGKSTVAQALRMHLLDEGHPVTVFDGDEVRRSISRDLGYSKEDRDIQVLRVAQLARDVVDANQVAVCALISPYRASRRQARDLIGAERFLEVFVDAPLEVCEARDPKGLYARARRGELTGFTGIDAPYESPLSADLTLHQPTESVEGSVRRVLALLWERGFALPAARR